MCDWSEVNGERTRKVVGLSVELTVFTGKIRMCEHWSVSGLVWRYGVSDQVAVPSAISGIGSDV